MVLVRTAKHVIKLTPFLLVANFVVHFLIIFEVLPVSNSMMVQLFCKKSTYAEIGTQRPLAKRKTSAVTGPPMGFQTESRVHSPAEAGD